MSGITKAADEAMYSRRPVITDPETAYSMAQRETDSLAAMMGADSKRIDGVVQDIGAIKGDVAAVRGEMGHVAKGVDSLRDALGVLVRHGVVMEQHAAAVTKMQDEQRSHDSRIKSLEVRAPGWDENRKWTIAAILAVVGLVGLAVLKSGIHL